MPLVSRRRRIVASLLPLAAALAAAGPAAAQVTLSTVVAPAIIEQPPTVTRHTFRLRIAPAWTRFDGWLDGSSGAYRALGSGLATDSLGAAQLPALSPYQSALETLTGDPAAKLSLGRLTAAARGRVMTAPLSLDYGLTSRLTITAVVPIVQTRTRIAMALNNNPADTGFATVGVNPQAWTTSSDVATAFVNAAASLAAEVQRCQASPGDPTCATIQADPAAASALAQTLASFGGAVATLYGTSANAPGAGFVPLAGSATLGAVNAHIANLNQAYRQYTGQDVTASTLPGAGARLATGALEQLFADPAVAGYDSLRTVEKFWIGDVALGASYQLVEPSRDSTSAVLWRSAVQGFVRFPTGRVARGENLFEVGTGDGRMNVDVRALADFLFAHRVGLGVGAQYTVGFGSIDLVRTPDASLFGAPILPAVATSWTPGNALQFDAAPRIFFTPNLTFDGYYSLRHRGDDTYQPTPGVQPAVYAPTLPVVIPGATEHRVGVGFGYTSAVWAGRHQMPLDARFLHTELVSASGGPALKTSRDEVRVRVYY